MSAVWPVHAEITGPIVLIGFGSIGKGILPLIERHFAFDKDRFTVIDPVDTDRAMLDDRGIRFVHKAITKDNFRADPGAAPDRRRRPGLLRQSLRRYRLARSDGALPCAGSALYRHGQ